MSHERNAHVVAAATEGLAELQAFRDAMEPSDGSFDAQAQALLETGVRFYRAALPMRALLLTDHHLSADFQDVARRTGMGPQLPVVELAAWVRHWQARGRIPASIRPESAALMVCGVADYVASLELTVPDDILREVVGSEADLLSLLLTALTAVPDLVAVDG